VGRGWEGVGKGLGWGGEGREGRRGEARGGEGWRGVGRGGERLEGEGRVGVGGEGGGKGVGHFRQCGAAVELEAAQRVRCNAQPTRRTAARRTAARHGGGGLVREGKARLGVDTDEVAAAALLPPLRIPPRHDEPR
jgi:hypothetical protein